MRELEQLIAEWRETITTTPCVARETVDELENHLRETVDQLVQSGMTETAAFWNAVTQIGPTTEIASEFKKLDQPIWFPVKLAIGIGFVVTIALAIYLASGLGSHRFTFLLASHIFAVTLGYTTAFLIGGLGICFVCQRCFSDFSGLRLLRRVTFLLGSLAAGLTAVGIVLGAVWAKAEWGRYWDWDAKETGGLIVLIWLLLFTAAHWWRGTATRVLLLLGIVGNIVVRLAWFGTNLLAVGLHSYRASDHLIFVAFTASNLVFLLAGLAPAGCLRFRET